MKKNKMILSLVFYILILIVLPNSLYSVEVSVRLEAQPNHYEGPCPATITFKGKITVSGRCAVHYLFIRSDGSEGKEEIYVFYGAGEKEVITTWTLWKDYEGWVLLKVLSPQVKESEKANFKTKCKVQPSRSAIPLAIYQEANEPSIMDTKDFSEVKFGYVKDKDILEIEILTYKLFSIETFFIYFDTDEDEAADIAITCLPTSFRVTRKTGSGRFDDTIYQGVPAVSGNSYRINIPWNSIFGNQKGFIFWVYSMETQDRDRVPDVDFLFYDFTNYKISNYADKDRDGINDFYEEFLLKRFRPYYKFSEKNGKKENYRPTDAVYQMSWGQLKDGDWPPGREPGTVKICGDSRESYRINPPRRILECLDGKLDLLTNPDKTRYFLNISDSKRGGSSWDEARSQSPGLYGHVVTVGNLIKIEYWQFFAYSGQDYVGDHEGDWCTIQLNYDPVMDRLTKTEHWAHGKGIAFDLTMTRSVANLENNIVEYRGPNYDTDPGNLHWDAAKAREHPRYPPPFQDNTVRFYRENNNLHVVVYVERDAHEFWPTEKGFWPGANEHNGKGPSYLVAYIPNKMNLGEVKYPLSEEAKIILRYNGFWGCYHHEWNSPPPGPTLHCQWTFPANEKDLEAKLKSKCEH